MKKLNSIRFKVLAALLGCVAAGFVGMLALMQYTFNRNAFLMATQSVKSAQNLFRISEEREINKMASLTELLNSNPQFGDTLAAQDRYKLISMTMPLFLKLKEDGITNWMFHSPEPNMVVFLRLHNPAVSGDRLNRFMDRQVASTLQMVSGNDLGRAGFAVRTIAPMFTSKGDPAGFVEFGEELGSFMALMKSQTGDDYALVLNKKFVNQKLWTDSSATLGKQNNWNDSPSTVLVSKTTASNSIFDFTGDLTALPNDGQVLQHYNEGHSVFVRGAFPVQDMEGRNIGAIFVVRNITDLYASMKHTEMLLTVTLVAGSVLFSIVFLVLLNRLIWSRLEKIIVVATRVVGGDFDTEIKVNSDDEVGQLEHLFEQFRQVFVDVLSHTHESTAEEETTLVP